MKKKIAFIINPISGTSRKRELPELIRRELDPDKWESPDIVFTQYQGHGHKLAAEYAQKGYDVVVACGGDGTMNEIASGLIKTQTAFAIIPYGSGNGLARHFGISMTPRKAIHQINEGESHLMDYGVVENEPFFCTCGTGFDAHISHAFAMASERGFFSYLRIIICEYFKYRSYKYKITVGDTTFMKRAFLVTFANASQYGNMAYIAPHASTRDGLLDICILDTFPIYSIPRLAWQLFLKKFDQSRHVTILRAKSVILERPYDGEFHIDGEPINLGSKIRVSCVPKGLMVHV